MIWQFVDILYLVGMVVIWVGNIKQITKLWQTKSTESFSATWLWTMLISFCLRLPRALTSDYWVWWGSYLISTGIILTLTLMALAYKKKNGGN